MGDGQYNENFLRAVMSICANDQEVRTLRGACCACPFDQNPNHFQKSPSAITPAATVRTPPACFDWSASVPAGFLSLATATVALQSVPEKKGRMQSHPAVANPNQNSVGLPDLRPAFVAKLCSGLQVVMTIRALCRKLRGSAIATELGSGLQRRTALNALLR